MKGFLYAGLGLLAVGLQITVIPDFALWGIRPNIVLVTVLALTLRWRDTFVFVYAAVLGMALDSFTHGLLGMYGIAFFTAAIAGRFAGGAMYEDNVVSATIVVFALSIVQGIVFVSVFKVFDRQVPWWGWTLARVLPEALYDAAIAPLVFIGIARLERWTRLQARA